MKKTRTTHTWIDSSFSQESMAIIHRSIDIFEYSKNEPSTKDFEQCMSDISWKWNRKSDTNKWCFILLDFKPKTKGADLKITTEEFWKLIIAGAVKSFFENNTTYFMEVTIYKRHLKDPYPTILINLSEVSFVDVHDFYYNTSYSAIAPSPSAFLAQPPFHLQVHLQQYLQNPYVTSNKQGNTLK